MSIENRTIIENVPSYSGPLLYNEAVAQYQDLQKATDLASNQLKTLPIIFGEGGEPAWWLYLGKNSTRGINLQTRVVDILKSSLACFAREKGLVIFPEEKRRQLSDWSERCQLAFTNEVNNHFLNRQKKTFLEAVIESAVLLGKVGLFFPDEINTDLIQGDLEKLINEHYNSLQNPQAEKGETWILFEETLAS